jgi:hypothetical protein
MPSLEFLDRRKLSVPALKARAVQVQNMGDGDGSGHR